MSESPIDLSGVLFRAEEFIAAVLETIEQPLWVVDHDGLIRFVSPAALTALGYERAEELLGRNSHATIHYRHRDGTPFPAAECPMLRPITSGETVSSELDWFIRRDGSMFPVSYVSVPFEMRDGRGALVAFTDIEERLRVEEVLREPGAAPSKRQASLQDELGRLADEQAALRRVATLVAQGVPPDELFAAVTEEVGRLLGTDAAAMIRYGPGEVLTAVGNWTIEGVDAVTEVGRQWPLVGESLAPRILKTGRSARIDDWRDVPGPIAEYVRTEQGVSSSVGSPIIVEGRVWGNLAVHSTTGPLPSDTEARLARFTELVATAVANSEARAEAARLTEEQAALRRVATLVAQGVLSGDLFNAVTEEVGTLLGMDLAGMIRFEGDETATAVATWAAAGAESEVAGELALLTGGGDLALTISKTGRPARIDDYDAFAEPIAASIREGLGICSSVGSPIAVEGRLWGALIVHSTHGELVPAHTEARLLNFTELVATAIANSEARGEVERLAEEQAGLRRVATLVARELPPAEVFASVAEEVRRLLRVEDTSVVRYEDDETATIVASSNEREFRVGDRLSLVGESVTERVFRTGLPARLDDYSLATGDFGSHLRGIGIRSAVGAPIVVEGRLWGAIVAATRQDEPLPAGTETRVGEFTELVATAISNIQARSDLAASRARIVSAADEERRRVVRDLHDGAQQRLVHTVIRLKLASRALDQGADVAPALVSDALDQAEQATAELRELAHGILPVVLTHGGLRAGVDALTARMSIPVENRVPLDRWPAEVEATAYFVVAEALTNIAKHAHAKRVTVTALIADGTLAVQVRDDGVGGARPDGSGLVGLHDRLAVLDGRLRVESPEDGGTLIAAAIPVADQPPA